LLELLSQLSEYPVSARNDNAIKPLTEPNGVRIIQQSQVAAVSAPTYTHTARWPKLLAEKCCLGRGRTKNLICLVWLKANPNSH